ncbi:MAG: AAA family ATPase [Prolixibacteraceae bacterium]|jgi:DNA sulfur modification protein DndD|nr:AAA family ATPase [Prolixibacteraceae bacterium]
MIIKGISLKNFKSFYGDNEFIFSNGLNIISGHEGAGKSNLFDAFMWVLFNRISGLKKGEKLAESNNSYINDRIKNESFINSSTEPIICEVQLNVIIPEENNKEYTVIRSKSIYLNKGHEKNVFYEKNVWTYENSELIVSCKDKNYNEEEYLNKEAETKLDSIFPEKIRKYIWFQGEQLNELLDFENPETLRKAIDYLSYLSVYEHMSDIISYSHNMLENRIVNSIRANNRDKKKFDNLKQEIDLKEKAIISGKSSKLLKEKALEKLISEEDELNEKLAILAGFPELKEKEGRLIGEIEMLKEQVSNLNDQEKTLFVNKWMLKGTDDLLMKADKEIAKFINYRQNLVTENRKQLAEGVPGDQLIHDMLEKQHCTVCDRPAKKGSPEFISIKSQLDSNKVVKALDYDIEDLYEKIISLRGKPSNILFKIKNIDENVTAHKSKIEFLLNERNRKNKELDNIREKIKEIVREKGHELLNLNPTNINSTLLRVRTDKITLMRQINSVTNDIILNETKLKNLYIEISKLKKSDEINIIEEKLVRYTEFLSEVISKQTEKEKIELIEKIQNSANDIQKSVANINNIVVVFIEIDRKDYTLKFVDANGNPNPSHGAQNTLAKMSIINAIVKLSNEKKNRNYPFIADAPTSDFAMEFTDRFLESVSNTYQQSIIITKDLISNLDLYKKKGYIKKLYELQKQCTEEIALSTNSITIIK